MELNEYQKLANGTAQYPGRGDTLGLYYTGLGLGEAGETQNQIKKMIRDDGGTVTQDRKEHIMKEMGGTLWYLANLATELGVDLDDIAQMNINQLYDR